MIGRTVHHLVPENQKFLQNYIVRKDQVTETMDIDTMYGV